MTDNSSSLINEQGLELMMQEAITWKMIESAQIKIIKEAFRLRYRKDNKLISEYASYVKNLRNAENKDEYIKYTAITLFPNEEAYNKRMTRYRKWYQGKKELLTSVEDLYNLYYKLSKKDRSMTETEIEEAVEDVLIDE
ncbi:11150_t:CDS:1 [Cetraspora pellucida]|uniref:11150_t:CDS:1 n=1 Tax=Cetraspora pellucida TaxID=1433469 RepID=A0ACA9KN38_9GLOM|nr:11150_t:CDS:1 [Cetraspora pellucida]